MEITNLTRDDVKSVLRCRAINNNISAPVETRILLDIIRKIVVELIHFIKKVSKKKFCKTCQESFVNKISWSI